MKGCNGEKFDDFIGKVLAKLSKSPQPSTVAAAAPASSPLSSQPVAAKSGASEMSDQLCVGEIVELHGLTRTELNGEEASVISLVPSTCRIGVQLSCGKTISVRAENLRPSAISMWQRNFI